MNWIKNFLKGREQRVVVNNEFSDWASGRYKAFLKAVCWVHLSSLFSLMTSQMISPQKSFFFADDTKLYNSAHLNHLIQEDLNHLLHMV